MKQTKYLFLALAFSILIFASLSVSAQAPNSQQTEAARNRPCADPWINIAFQQLGYGTPGGFGNYGDCNTQLYNGGSWSSYEQLKGYVKTAQEQMTQAGYEYTLVKMKDDPSKLAVALTRGSSIIAQGGGNVITNAGGNIVTNASSNFNVSTSMFNNLPVSNLVSVGQRTVFAADQTVIRIGGRAIVFTKR
jgi:hypothetical protein